MTIYTIGHSTHPAEEFVRLLNAHGINAIADVRSSPYSRMNPQFNREVLRQTLRQAGISYVFLGAELGARSPDPACYEEGKVRYDRLAAKAEFVRGLERIETGSQKFSIAAMCSEGDPLTCHRTILVARRLAERGADILHIRADGSLEPHPAAVDRLLREVGLGGDDLFWPKSERIVEAYARREADIAYDKNAVAKFDRPDKEVQP